MLESNIVLHFFQLLISDSIKTRKLATSFCASWFKINRQKAKKIVKNINLINGGENNGISFKWSIKFGINEGLLKKFLGEKEANMENKK